MLKTISGVLAIIFGIQLAQSLDCYHCVSSGFDCTNVKQVTCNQKIANETSSLLSQFKTVPKVISNNFECMWFNHTRINNDQYYQTEIRSCAYKEIDTCSRRSRSEIIGSTWSCRSCSTNLCNRNSAGTFLSSFLTLPIVVLGLLAMKILGK